MKSFFSFAIVLTLLLALAAAASGQKAQKREAAIPRPPAAVLVLPLPVPPAAPAVGLPSREEPSPVCGPHNLKCNKCSHCVDGECVKKTPSAAPSADPEAVCR